MVGQVDHRILVGGGRVIEAQLVVVGEGVADRGHQVPGIALLAVVALVLQLQRVAVGLDRRPKALVEALVAAVQGVPAVVGGELVLLAVEGEARLADAVGIAAHHLAGEEVVLEIAVQIVEAEHHVAQLALGVEDLQRNHGGAPGHDPGFHPVAVGQREQLDRSSVGGLAEWGARRQRRNRQPVCAKTQKSHVFTFDGE